MSNQETALRTTIRVNADETETLLADMGELREGDRFRIETDHTDDHMHGQRHVVWTADEDPTRRDGVWGIKCHAEIGNGEQDWNEADPLPPEDNL